MVVVLCFAIEALVTQSGGGELGGGNSGTLTQALTKWQAIEPYVMTAFGAGIVAAAIATAALSGNKNKLRTAQSLFDAVPFLCKILRAPPIEEGSEGITLAVLAAVDVVSYGASAGLGYARAFDLIGASPGAEGRLSHCSSLASRGHRRHCAFR